MSIGTQPLKIAIFSQSAGSPSHGMVFRNYAWAREWVKQGHQVTIIAGQFVHTRSTNPKAKNRITQEDIHGVHYIWLWGNRYTQASVLGRVLSMALYMAQCLFLKLPLEKNYDLVIASSPHPFVIFPAHQLAKKCKAKLIYDVRDLWPLTLLHLGTYTKANPLIRLMDWAERYACRHADLVTAVPSNCKDYLVTQGLSPDRFMAVANGLVIEEHEQVQTLPNTHRALFDRLKQENAFIIGYAGALGTANAMHILIEALPYTAEIIHTVIVGHGAYRDQLIERAKQLQVDHRVHILEPVLRDHVQSFLHHCDVAYLGLKSSPLYAMGASLTKLNDYLLAAKPVIYAGEDPLNPVEQSGCGLLCRAENSKDVAGAIERLQQMPVEERQAMGQKGHDWLMANQLVSDQVKRIIKTVFKQ